MRMVLACPVLKGDTDISAINSGETFDTRNTIFAPDPHEHYDRSGSIPSQPHVRGITVANSTYNSVTFSVTFSETVTGVDASDFVAYKDGNPYGPAITNDTATPNARLHNNPGVLEETIIVSGYDKDTTSGVVLGVDVAHNSRGDLRFYLTSPEGTKKLASPYPYSDTEDDLVATFDFVFVDEEMNGEWTLRVEDYTNREPIENFAFLNEWSLDIAYQAEPIYQELQVLAAQLGDANAFAPLPEGPHTLRLYPDALGVASIRSDGVLFDPYHHEVLTFDPFLSSNKVLFTSNSYLRYPMTVDVTIHDVRISAHRDCSNALEFDIGRTYAAGDILMVPVLPGTSVLCLTIAGAEVIIYLDDVLTQSIISSIPATAFDGKRSTSGTATFIGQDGVVTATVTAAARGHVTVDRNLNYNAVYQYWPFAKFHNSDERLYPNGAAVATVLMDEHKAYWDRVGAATSWSAYTSLPSLTMNVYRNGDLIETRQEAVTNMNVEAVNSNVVRYEMDQHLEAHFELIELSEIVLFDVKKGDFIQVEIIADTDIRFPYPRTWFPTGYYFHPTYTPPSGNTSCEAYGVGSPSNYCANGQTPKSVYVEKTFPDARPIIDMNQTKQLEITGGYVIFAGN